MADLTIVMKTAFEPCGNGLEQEETSPLGIAAAQVVRAVQEMDEVNISCDGAEEHERLFGLLDGATMILVRVEP